MVEPSIGWLMEAIKPVVTEKTESQYQEKRSYIRLGCLGQSGVWSYSQKDWFFNGKLGHNCRNFELFSPEETKRVTTETNQFKCRGTSKI